MKAIIGKQYKHYKGREYTVLSIARLESNPEQVCIVYRADYETEFGKESVWIRPIEDFEAEIKIDGQKVHRFSYIDRPY